MSALLITPKTLVADVLRQVPQSSHVFIANHTDCVGCRLVRFCTLEEVARQYPMDLTAFIADLARAGQAGPDADRRGD